ncbi:MAG TPA: polysaccharide deacetylase family protein [Candidatus Obscuribacterales bacterium]|nr:polysaccharide deacetylase family protein [Candidatus Obscuribacterales bacterium]
MRFALKVLSAGLACAFPLQAAFAQAPGCAKADALGVSRTVEIDTTGGPGFGLDHYKAFDFLQPKEVVLTFDDGPQKFSTEMVLAALAEHCTKATFFSIGKMALGYPEIIREVAKGGHTVGTHTWSHQNLRKSKTAKDAETEIERGISAVQRAVGAPIAPFFRFPTLQDSPEALAHLQGRNVAMFSTDVDSFDFKIQPPANLVKGIISKLDKKGKGILLMHDIHKNTAKALPLLLTELKANGYKIVHITAKAPVTTLAEYDALIEKDTKGLPQAGSDRPTSSVVRTISGTPTAEETAPPSAPLPALVPQGLTTPPAEIAPAPTITAAPAAPVSPVATVPTTTSSISSSATAPSNPVSTSKGAGTESPDGAGKSFSDKARDVWDLWFGK